jgi:hypothetical protein
MMPQDSELTRFEQWEASVGLLEENEVALLENQVRLYLTTFLLNRTEEAMFETDNNLLACRYLTSARWGRYMQSLFEMDRLRLRRNHKTLYARVAQCRQEWGA